MIKMSMHRIARNLFRLFNRLLRKLGFVLSKPDFVHGSPAFSGALVLSRRMFQTKEFLDAISDVEGDIFEGGIHWGYGLTIELLLSEKKIYAFDSFEGHSKATVYDKNSKSWKPFDSSFAVTKKDAVKTILLGTNLSIEEVDKRIVFYEGWVNETIPKWKSEMIAAQKKLAYVHADMDIYDPIKCILMETYPFLSPGAIVCVGMIDNPELAGKTRAFKEFLESIDQNEIEIKTRNLINTKGVEAAQTYFVRK
jgi:hypothetical protein